MHLLDTPAEEPFDRLTRLASRALGVPIALVTLMDEERQFFKSQCGLREPWASRRETPLSHSFCQHVVGSGEPLIVEDAREDPLLRDNLAIPDLGVVAYAGFPIRIGDGQVLGAFCAIDHHARQWTEEEQMVLADLAATAASEIEWRVAREGELRFRSLAETASEAILTMDSESVILSANPAVEQIFGYTAVDLVGRPLSILIPERFREAHAAGVRRYLQTGKRNIPWKGVELPGLTRSGEEIPLEISFGEYIHEGSHIFTGFVRDTRERKRAEEALRRSAERFRSLTAATTQIVWVTDPEGMLLPDQTQWGAFTGQSAEEYRGWGWLEAIHPEDRERTAEAWSSAVESRTPYQVEHRLRRHDGEYRVFQVRGVPVLETDGSIREWVGTHTDVTDQRRAQEERDFLGEASRILASSLDYETTLQDVAHVAVPAHADFCLVDLVGLEGEIRRVATAHRDPQKEELYREIQRRYPPDPERSPLARVVRTGEPLLLPEITEEWLDVIARNEEHRRLIRDELGTRSLMTIPLSARGQTLGVLTYGSTRDSERRYGPRDLELAEEFARRAATAVDQARLFQEAEEARASLEHQAMELESHMEELQTQAAQLEENQIELEMSNEDLQRLNAELGAAEAHYRRLVETSPYGVYVLGAQGDFREMNPAGERILGRSSSEMLGRHFGELVAPEDLETASDAFMRVISGRDGDLELDLCIQRPSGELRLVNVVITAIRESTGKITGIHGMFRDITEERRTQNALKESEMIHRLMVNSVQDYGIFMLDPEGRIASWNAGAERIKGYAREEVLGKHFSLFYTPEDVERDYPAYELETAAREGRFVDEGWRVRKDGSLFWAYVVITAVRDEGGELVGFAKVTRDLTERKQAEEQLRESERRQRTLLQAVPDVIFRQTRAGEYLDFQAPEGTRDLFVPPEQIIGRKVQDLLPGGVAEAILAHTEQALAEGRVQKFEYVLPMPGGMQTFEARLVPSGPDEVLTLIRNITEQKRSEEREKELRREQVIRAQAEAANRAKSEFLSRMSHELRTPLNAILGFGQVLELDLKAAEDRESVAHILKAGQHLLSLIDEVLDIARIEAGQMSLSVEPVSVQQVLQESVDLVRVTAAKRGITLRARDALAAEHFVQADQQRLKQVLLNLLSNAIKYNRTEGTVTLSCEKVGEDRLRIGVQDTGYGISDEKMGRLFTPFDRLGADQTSVEGTGLGLALSKGLIEAMGGRLGVESAEGEGSRFWVELPLARRPAVNEAVRVRSQEDVPTGAVGVTHTVLFVEDNLANVRLMERVFQRRPEVRLLTAMQGSLGLDLAREHRPDLILLDLNLPDLSGDKVLLQIRQDPVLRQIPVVMISGDAIPSQVQRMLDLGAQGYITKPFDIQELLRVVDEGLQREGR